MVDPRFSQVQGSPPKAGPPRSGGGIPVLPIVFLLIYGLYVGFMVIAPYYSKGLANTLNGIMAANIRLIIGGILLGVFVLVMLYNLLGSEKGRPAQVPPGQGGRSLRGPEGPPQKKFIPVQPQTAPPATTPRPGPRPEPTPPSAASSPEKVPAGPKLTILPYPSMVGGGIYGETFIPLSQTKMLKLRSLVVGPEYLK